MAMFKRVDSPPPIAPKKKGKIREQIKVAGLQQLAILDALIDHVTALQSTIKAEVVEAGFAHYVELAGETSTRPTSFEGVEGTASASIEIRKRSTVSPLTEDEVKVLQDADIEPEEKIIQPFQFFVNPIYATDEKLLARVEAALAKIVPGDFIQQQPKVTKYIVNEAMLDTAFLKGKDEEILRILTTLAVKPKLNEAYDQSNLLSDALEILQPSKKKASVKTPVNLKRVK